VFALTGGIGSGKSAVGAVFRAAGVPVVDADELARRVVLPGTSTLQEIVAAFGAEYLLPDGTLDRQKLGQLVFSDEDARARLNAIVHPAIQAVAQAEFARHLTAGAKIVCYEVPLLFETAQQDLYRPVVVVDAPLEDRIRRVVGRDGLSEAEARARALAQLPLAEKVNDADVIVSNTGSKSDLEKAAQRALLEVRAFCEANG
jgi:dephospho-CoA kinase